MLSKTEVIAEPLEVLADEWGTTNDGILEYNNRNIIIRLNNGTKLSDFKALSVYCATYKVSLFLLAKITYKCCQYILAI